MDTRAYELDMLKRQAELLKEEPTNQIDKAIIDLEMILCNIKPYSVWWRCGYIRSLQLAIKALKQKEKIEIVRDERPYEERRKDYIEAAKALKHGEEE